MEIEIITTNTNSIPTNSIPAEQETNVEEKKELSPVEIDNIANKVLGDILEYFSKETTLEHMRDEIIKQRIYAITKEKYYHRIQQTIRNLIKLLHEDSYIFEYIEIHGKCIYGIGNSIDEIIYDNVLDETPYILDIAECWLNWDDYNSSIGHDILINSIIKNVFQSLDDRFEYAINNNHEEPDESDDDSDDSPDDLSSLTKEKDSDDDIQCVIC